MITDRAIASLSLVKTLWDSNNKNDYIENFVPFVATLIKNKKYTHIPVDNMEKFLEDFKNEFGLDIPYHPMLTILRRCKTKKILKKENISYYVPINENVIKYDFTAKELQKKAEIEELMEKFIIFAKQDFNISLMKNETYNILNSFLYDYDLDILFASQYTEHLLPETKVISSYKYIMCSYINHLRTHEYVFFEKFVDIAIGHILANSIIYNPKTNIDLNDLNIYFDSKCIFYLLGVMGKENQKIYEKLTQTLDKNKVNLYIFNHTKDEILKILKTCLRFINSPDYDIEKASPVLRYFKDNDYNSSDIQQFIISLDEKLVSYNIKTMDTPSIKEYKIDETTLKAKIKDIYEQHTAPEKIEAKKDTIDKDITSIAAIIFLRKGTKAQNLKEAKHIFVTPNTALAYANKLFEKNSDFNYIPACITDVFLGTAIWIQNPTVFVDKNKEVLIARCSVVVQPNPALVKKIVQTADKLKTSGQINETDYLLLRNYPFLHQEIANKTAGNVESLKESLIEEILQDMKNNMTAEYLEKLAIEKNEKKEKERELEQEKEKIRLIQIKKNKLSAQIDIAVKVVVFIILLILAVCFYYFINDISGFIMFSLDIILLFFLKTNKFEFIQKILTSISTKISTKINNKLYGI